MNGSRSTFILATACIYITSVVVAELVLSGQCRGLGVLFVLVLLVYGGIGWLTGRRSPLLWFWVLLGGLVALIMVADMYHYMSR